MGKYFGTDGIRGVVNAGLDAMLAYKTGQATAAVLSENKSGRPLICIGKDTRLSCDMLESALVAGLCSAGADVMALGVIPTPAVAYITVDCNADAGIVISASHNPFEHNGIKIFNSKGYKLSDELELRIEELIDNIEEVPLETEGGIGRVSWNSGQYKARYLEHIISCAEHDIKRLRIAVDCANGAACTTAEEVFSRFPLDVTFIGSNPDGVNINEKCGSTHIERLSELVVRGKFDLGIAFDGDADRCLVVDENGSLVDGDKIMAVCATGMKKMGKLSKDAFVATVMSNMGLHEYSRNRDIHVHTASVGDRNVLEMMQEHELVLGGEQSGHLIFLNDSTTGDGQLAAVKFLSVLSESGKKVSELVSEIPTYPQILTNIKINGGNKVKDELMSDDVIRQAIRAEEEKLGENGRVLVRPSGTEALIRVMVEAIREDITNNCSEYLTNLIKERAENIFH